MTKSVPRLEKKRTWSYIKHDYGFSVEAFEGWVQGILKAGTTMKILVLNGPNLALLGKREVDIYGSVTLQAIEEHLQQVGAELNVEVECFQSDCEGALVSRIGALLLHGEDPAVAADGILINPGAYSHYSIAIYDALRAVAHRVPALEIHLSNIASRESFRHEMVTAPACIGVIAGLGANGYEWGLRALVERLRSCSEVPQTISH